MRRLGQKNLLYVYDCGYLAERFIDQHILLGFDFLFRLPKDFNKATTKICSCADSEGFIAREGWPLLSMVLYGRGISKAKNYNAVGEFFR
jgi:hypothetical protein